MASPNVVGYVTEYSENREVVRSEFGDLIPGPVKMMLKLRLINTLGEEKIIWVEGPSELGDFFSAEHTREDLAKALTA